MLPLSLVLAGLIVFAAGLVILRSFGSGVRIGRLLSVTPRVTIEEALALAASGRRAFVAVEGRIDAVDEFLDENDRPLVYRRRRIQLRGAGRWRTVDETVERVPFAIDEHGASIAVDPADLGVGLVVLPRESTGTAGEIPDRVPAGTSPSTPVRLRVELVSSVEHATVLGRPVAGPDGTVALRPDGGRPLVLSTLERDDAMRVLAEGRRGRAALVVVLLVTGPGLVVAGLATALVAGLG